MARVEVDYVPPGNTLAAFHRSNAPVRVITGPFGSAKTTACCMELYRRAIEQEPINGIRKTRMLIVRSTYPELETTTINSWRGIFDDSFGQFTFAPPQEHKLRFNLDDGTEVHCDVIFMALDGPDALDKLKGFEPTIIWLNELKEMPQAIFNMAIGRCGRYPAMRDGGPTFYGLIADSNKSDEDHYLYELQYNTPKNLEFFDQPPAATYDEKAKEWILNENAENIANLPPGYYENLIHLNPHDWVWVYVGNRYGYVQEGKPVIPDYDDGLMAMDLKPIDGIPLTGGLDFGLTPACTIGQRHPRGPWLTLAELVTFEMGVDRFGDLLVPFIRERFPNHDIGILYADPSGKFRDEHFETNSIDIIRGKGLNVQPAPTNDQKVRIEATRKPMTRLIDGKPGYMVDKSCKMLRKGLSGAWCYRRLKVKGAERYTEKPDKNDYSHVCDANGYMLSGGGETRPTRSSNFNKPPGQPIVANTNFNPLGR